ncbi:MAG: polysaccharide deacetylase family protein [Acidobacteria bacterium]|jgi:peptidoglycan/xylan/chitin deacetylase (PgdA/CDA1 family)|nr:polysaccharide deacetylase family protein [Acidobacteriota bacterium]
MNKTNDFKKVVLWTNDVETHSIWFNEERDETGLLVLNKGMPLLLDVYREYGITSTFFFTGVMAQKFPQVVRMILKDHHEVGSHGYVHEPGQALDLLPYEKQLAHLKKSKQILEDISGQEVISFRAPALRVNHFTAAALVEAGFKIDSSVAPQRFDMFLSFGGINKLKWLSAPRFPYRTDINNLLKRGNDGVVEVPLSALILPYNGTFMRLSPFITGGQRRLLHLESACTGKPVVFDIHPNEFLNEEKQERVIKRRAQNVMAYLWSDWLRGKLKVKNLGKKAIPLFKREIEFFKQNGYCFMTLKDYCQKGEKLFK